MPGSELREHAPHAERDRMHADRGPRDAADLFPYAQRITRALATELPPPRLVGHFAPVRLAGHQDVHVLESVCRIDGHAEGSRLVLAERVAVGREAAPAVGVRDPPPPGRS